MNVIEYLREINVDPTETEVFSAAVETGTIEKLSDRADSRSNVPTGVSRITLVFNVSR